MRTPGLSFFQIWVVSVIIIAIYLVVVEGYDNILRRLTELNIDFGNIKEFFTKLLK
jgi:hypothetical protein